MSCGRFMTLGFGGAEGLPFFTNHKAEKTEGFQFSVIPQWNQLKNNLALASSLPHLKLRTTSGGSAAGLHICIIRFHLNGGDEHIGG